jgi:hypothetical protein
MKESKKVALITGITGQDGSYLSVALRAIPEQHTCVGEGRGSHQAAHIVTTHRITGHFARERTLGIGEQKPRRNIPPLSILILMATPSAA